MGKKKFKPIVITNRLITGIAEDAKAVCRTDEGIVCFVDGAVPGDTVDIKIHSKKKGFYLANIDTLVKPSPNRIEAQCNHFGICGGCKWQHLKYEAQVTEKENKVSQAIERIGKVSPLQTLPILTCDRIFNYRNKLEFTFTNKKWLTDQEMQQPEIEKKQPGIGFHRAGTFDQVVDIYNCHLQKDPSNQIRNFIRSYALKKKLSFFNVRGREGFLRNLLIKTTSTGQIMVLLSFHYDEPDIIKPLLNELMSHFPSITTAIYTINPKANDTILDLEMQVYSGQGFIIESLGNIQYKIGPKSFFQTNTAQTIKLFDQAIKFAELNPDDIVYDLYTGLGSIALYAASQCKKIIGIENVAPAIEDAKENARFNGIENAYFHTGNVEDIFDENFIDQYGKADVIITDPPRAGMHERVIETLLKAEAKRIVYISCNPATQARDIQMLSSKYELAVIQAVDMFPHTGHVESIGVLHLK